MKVLMVSPEAIPFIKTGGLADVAGSLPKSLLGEGIDARVIIPKYLCIDPDILGDLKFVCAVSVTLNWRKQPAAIYSTVCGGVTYYLVENEYYFAGPKPYGEIYQDAEKFAFFCKAVLTALPQIGFCPDIIHLNDWQTGLIAPMLKQQFALDEFYSDIKTIFTIHNLKFQGRWHIDSVKDITGLPDSCFTIDGMECYGSASLLKAGLAYSNYITTVSPTYAVEIQEKDGGEGLEGAIAKRKGELLGILNGIDIETFNPETDSAIDVLFEGDISSYKRANKVSLQAQKGLKENPDAFMIGMVSRLTDQKGFDLVNAVLEELLGEHNVRFVLIGTGDQRYEDSLRAFAEKYPEKISVDIRFDEAYSRKIYASCDVILVPSMTEPCGLSQMIGMRYGAVPVVREVGGLKDTVVPYSEENKTGTGFTFANYDAFKMMDAIRRAKQLFEEDPEGWKKLAIRCMQVDFSWRNSAKEYAKLYSDVSNDIV